MKKILSLLVFFSIFNFTNAQDTINFNKENFIDSISKIDKELSQKLEIFFANGYENAIEISDLKPEDLILTAEKYLGTPHCMGGVTKECIDCSGLLFAVFNELKIEIPHGSQEMARYGKIIINPDDLEKGDLVFFVKSYNTSKVITHSGFYMGEGMFIHTSSRNGVEEINFINSSYWSEKFIFGTRIFELDN